MGNILLIVAQLLKSATQECLIVAHCRANKNTYTIHNPGFLISRRCIKGC